jgi:hypothetical protein
MTQLALPFEKQAPPEVSQREIEEMILRLFQAQKWLTAADLGAHTEQDRRRVRAIASVSGGHIISGQKGYTLNFLATDEEADASSGWLERQGADMQRRADEQRRVRHHDLKPPCLRHLLP